MRTNLAIVTACLVLLASVPAAVAHHAFAAEFDVNKPVTLKGTMKKWDMINPHSWFYIDVKGTDGKVVEWMVEGGSPNTLIRLGVTKYTVEIGTELTIEGRVEDDRCIQAVIKNEALGGNFPIAIARGGRCGR